MRLRRIAVWVVISSLMCLFIPSYCFADIGEYGGHYYEFVGDGKTWEEAKIEASTKSYMGITGHLATISSDEENDFIADLLGVDNTAWIGLSQAPGATAEADGWQWVTGEPLVYTSWGAGEPNDMDPGEDHQEDYCSLYANDATWNDATGGGLGYVVEYDEFGEPFTPAEQFGGHYYEVVLGRDGSWEEASQIAANMLFRGLPGHLVTIESQEENTFIADILGPSQQAWIGLYQPPEATEPNGGWVWVTGEPSTYLNWADGEPNDGGGEDHAAIQSDSGEWNDCPTWFDLRFVVEWDGSGAGNSGSLTVTVVKSDGGDVSGLPVSFDGELRATLHTNSEGGLRVVGLGAGTYTVDASDEGYETSGPVEVVFATGHDELSATITLTPTPPLPQPPGPGTVKGQIMEGTGGAPLPGVLVKLRDESGVVKDMAVSWLDGQFEFNGVEPGAYEITALVDGYGVVSAPAAVTNDTTTTVVLIRGDLP